MRFVLIFASLLAAAPAFAEEAYEVTTYGPLLEQCYEDAAGAESKAQCVGALAQSCMTSEEGGETTLGMSRCQNAEAQVWDRFLNREYRETMRAVKAMDADEAETFPEFAGRAAALRDAQRAWIGYRDASCALEYALWGAGSMRHIAGTACEMEVVAERTIELVRMREMFE